MFTRTCRSEPWRIAELPTPARWWPKWRRADREKCRGQPGREPLDRFARRTGDRSNGATGAGRLRHRLGKTLQRSIQRLRDGESVQPGCRRRCRHDIKILLLTRSSPTAIIHATGYSSRRPAARKLSKEAKRRGRGLPDSSTREPGNRKRRGRNRRPGPRINRSRKTRFGYFATTAREGQGIAVRGPIRAESCEHEWPRGRRSQDSNWGCANRRQVPTTRQNVANRRACQIFEIDVAGNEALVGGKPGIIVILVPPFGQTVATWYGNINPLAIDYAFRPRLRS